MRGSLIIFGAAEACVFLRTPERQLMVVALLIRNIAVTLTFIVTL